MHVQRASKTQAVLHLLLCLQMVVSSGCSRRFWRRQADEDVYRAVSEKQTDPRWHLPRMDMTPDPRSRFYDPYDPDAEPLPPDDPAANRFMLVSDGKEGYKNWGKFGVAFSVENPHWLEPYRMLLGDVDPSTAHSMIDIPSVTLRDSVDLTYIHSREYQTEIEDVYLAALALTLQRYQLNSRFLIGGDGSGVGGGLFSGAYPRNGTNTSGLQNGIGLTQMLPVGTTIAVDILNTISWSSGTGNGTATRLAWSVTQPFLNGAGRKIVMETLTQAERTLLYEVRNLARFRRTLFTSVASDFLRILQQIQTIENLENNIRQLERQIEISRAAESRKASRANERLRRLPPGFVIPGDLSQLSFDEELENLRWEGPMTAAQRGRLLSLSDDAGFQTAIRQVIAQLEGTATPLSLTQLVTRLNRLESQLASSRRVKEDLLDGFKIRLGLPTNARMTADTVLLSPFQLIDPSIVDIENQLNALALEKGPQLILIDEAPDVPPTINLPAVREYLDILTQIRDSLEVEGLVRVKSEFEPLAAVLSDTAGSGIDVGGTPRTFFTEEEADRVAADVASDQRLYEINEREFTKISRSMDLLKSLLANPDDEAVLSSIDTNGDGIVEAQELPANWEDLPGAELPADGEGLTSQEILVALRYAALGLQEDMVKVTQGLQVVQVGLRVEAITLNPFTLPGSDYVPDIEEVVQIAIENRHDLMNAKAAVMDARRAVEIAANSLMSAMNLTASGTFDPAGGSGNDDLDIGIEFKAPLDQVAERNDYRTALVNYQRERRTYMALEDLVKQQVRESWRQLMVSRQRLEIDRQTVRNAALEYDNAALLATGVGQNNSFNILNALDAVLGAQNSLVADWITYETNRLNIFRDMGIMQVDPTGMWDDEFYQLNAISPLSDAPDSPAFIPPTELNPALLSPQPLPENVPVLRFPNE